MIDVTPVIAPAPAPMSSTHLSRSPDDTRALARELARTLDAGDVLALHGDLGAGKTQFVRGIVEGLGGSAAPVSSPTFVLLNIYPTPTLTVYHLDAYRALGEDDFDAIGFDELLEQNGIVAVEWAERIASRLPGHTVHIRLTPLDEQTRQITIDRP
ncbi:MAG TPA: tRNA (adenosine(37)-N6)-threonylcarbamoyltransferase complex ATPase subunit type 1 TsaE [Tepidisphaeraceae bacterium]|nr:tRNA (adenosine(37)-N6)-threonylcarbamoyltransferase complex ATPase subunit type 1 TsaE [Tepidisphaeraceae bacterium]